MPIHKALAVADSCRRTEAKLSCRAAVSVTAGAERRILILGGGQALSPCRAAYRPSGRHAGKQYRRRHVRRATAAVQIQDSRSARQDWLAQRGGRDSRLELLRDRRAVFVARDLPEQAPRYPEESSRCARLAARLLLLDGHRPVGEVTVSNRVGGGRGSHSCNQGSTDWGGKVPVLNQHESRRDLRGYRRVADHRRLCPSTHHDREISCEATITTIS